MGNLIILKILQQLDSKAAAAKCNGFQWLRMRWDKLPVLASPSRSNTGFTLIEIVVVMLIVGILSAIMAPSWSAFINRQRLNEANDAVLRALQGAQREAKRTKLSYNVSFISVQGQVPQVSIYPTNSTPTLWTSLGGDIALRPGQILLYTNINSSTPNYVVSSNSLSLPNSSNPPTTITFDYTGSLPKANFGSPPIGLKVVVAQGTSQGPNPPMRCVIVKNLIGGMQTAISPAPSSTTQLNPCSAATPLSSL